MFFFQYLEAWNFLDITSRRAEEHAKFHHFLVNLIVPKFVLEPLECPTVGKHLICKHL